MENKNFKIAVSGDICINFLLWKTNQQCDKGFSWESFPQLHNNLKAGEALLLSKLVKLATDATIISPQIQSVEAYLLKELLLSTVELDIFPRAIDEKDDSKVYRIKQYLGFTGSPSGIPKLLPIVDDDEQADLVIIDDEDNGFNENEE